MKKRDRTQWLWGLAGLALTVLATVLQRSSIYGTARRWMKLLSDGTLLACALLVVIALVTLCVLNGLLADFGIGKAMAARKKEGRDPNRQTFGEFVDKTEKKGKGCPTLLPGIGYLILAVIFTGLYYLIK